MNVYINDVPDLFEMPFGNKGITLSVYDTDEKVVGKLRLGKGTVEWCGRNIQAGNGIQVGWDELVQWFDSQK